MGNYRSIVVVVSRARRAEPEIGGNLTPPDGSNRRFVSTTTERVRSESDAGVFPSDNCIPVSFLAFLTALGILYFPEEIRTHNNKNNNNKSARITTQFQIYKRKSWSQKRS